MANNTDLIKKEAGKLPHRGIFDKELLPEFLSLAEIDIFWRAS
jgi:hypothetical protein